MKDLKKSHVSITVLVFLLVGIFILGINFISAFSSSNVGANASSNNLTEDYHYGESIRGSINISLTNEPANTNVSLFSNNTLVSSTTLLDLLKSSNMISATDYLCTPSSCEDSFTSSDTGTTTKSFSLVSGENKTIGLKFTSGSIASGSLINFSINFSSDALASCTPQLRVRIPQDPYNSYLYTSNIPGNSYCSESDYGCFSSQNSQNITLQRNINYCSQIQINSGAAIEAGANVYGAGAANFTFNIGDYSCNNATPVSCCQLARTISSAT